MEMEWQEQNNFFAFIEKGDAHHLEQVITKEEIETAINRMKTGKRVGPNGLPTDIYKKI